MDIKHSLARILGNFGTDFLKPLVGINVGMSIFGFSITWQHIFWASFVAAMIGAGLTISKEAIAYGNKKDKN